MKFEITKRGVYDGKGEPIGVGTTLDIDSDTVPAYLVNKGEAKSGGKTAVTNPAKGAVNDRSARLKELAEGLSEDDFTEAGVPDVRKVNELLNEGEEPFTAAERDKLWSAD